MLTKVVGFSGGKQTAFYSQLGFQTAEFGHAYSAIHFGNGIPGER